jgi:hypothetical protein
MYSRGPRRSITGLTRQPWHVVVEHRGRNLCRRAGGKVLFDSIQRI